MTFDQWRPFASRLVALARTEFLALAAVLAVCLGVMTFIDASVRCVASATTVPTEAYGSYTPEPAAVSIHTPGKVDADVAVVGHGMIWPRVPLVVPISNHASTDSILPTRGIVMDAVSGERTSIQP